ncbi:hypothetical protein EYF80_003971 [Liparis tanakae]|uniref:Uncharacterized protein n=1 Tax=Liparis tanakae TaxID=230148 RepID=A0A4Z2J749_9TELE|nr:hypothetical protein EYF80_003971 [Liparis tanakae]
MLLSQWPELLTAKKKKKKKKKKGCEPVFNIRVLERTALRRGYFNNNVYFHQLENLTVPKYGNVYGENNQSGQHGYEEGSRQRFYNEGPNEQTQTQTEWPSPAVCYTQDVSARNEHYDWDTSRAQQWYDSTSRRNDDVVSREGHQMNLDVAQPYYYQQLQHHQSMAPRHAGLMMGSAGQHGEAWGASAQSGAAWINDRPYLGHPFAHSGSFAPQPPGPFLHIEQRPLPTYMGVDHWS